MTGDSSTVRRAGIVGIALLVAFSMIAGIGAGAIATENSPKVGGDVTDGADDGDDSEDTEDSEDADDGEDSEETAEDDSDDTAEDGAAEEIEVTADDVEEVVGENEGMMAMMEEMGMTFQDVADILNEMLSQMMASASSA